MWRLLSSRSVSGPSRRPTPAIPTLGCLLLLACGQRAPEPPGSDQPPLDAATATSRAMAFFAGRPRWEQPLGTGLTPVPGLENLSAKTCGACHTAIYEEWRQSTHAAAWIDPQYQAEITKSGNRWLCLNCHTPLLVQQDRWPHGLVEDDVERPLLFDNPTFDSALRDEGITCAVCHVRDGKVRASHPAPTAPHPIEVDPTLGTNAVCSRCHQATATYPGKNFTCTFDTETEWRQSQAAARGEGCQTCHMPAVERPVATGSPPRAGHQHWWRGAGIPKVAGVHPPRSANPPGLSLTPTWAPDALVLTLGNPRAGHSLPTGDPERFIVIEIQLRAPDHTVLDTHTNRIGQHWEWEPTPRKLSDNRLTPGETRTLRHPLPQGATSAIVRVHSHRLTEETARYHHLDDYPRSVLTHHLEVSATGIREMPLDLP